jgi:hypothetical protein
MNKLYLPNKIDKAANQKKSFQKKAFFFGILSIELQAFAVTTKNTRPRKAWYHWRRHPDLNRGVRVLQTLALPLGYGAALIETMHAPGAVIVTVMHQ